VRAYLRLTRDGGTGWIDSPIVRLGSDPGVRAERPDHEVLPMPTTSIRRLAVPAVVVLVLALAAAVVLGAGVAIGSSARSVAGSDAASGPTSVAGDGTVGDLDALLAADQSSTKPVNANRSVAGLRRLAAGERLVHATVLVDLPALGGLTTIQIDHGTIKAVGPTSLSVSETGGTTATVAVGDETRVRKHAAKATAGDLAVGDEVFVMSKVTGAGTEAYLVVVPAS
jgi:hypothetical protein